MAEEIIREHAPGMPPARARRARRRTDSQITVRYRVFLNGREFWVSKAKLRFFLKLVKNYRGGLQSLEEQLRKIVGEDDK